MAAEAAASLSWIALMVFFVPVALVALLGFCALIGIKLLKGSGRDRQSMEDETRMIQEIYSGLSQMEKRLETLETIIIEKEGEKE